MFQKKILSFIVALIVMCFLNLDASYARFLNIKAYGAKADGKANDTKAILKALTLLKDDDTLYFQGKFLVTPEYSIQNTWEAAPVIFNLPNKRFTILGGSTAEFILGNTKGNALSIFRTAFCSTKKIVIKSIKIIGKGNKGVVGNLIDGITVNGSKFGEFSDISIVDTKRHGIYMIYGASYNTLKNINVKGTNREMLGCGLQLEGASKNIFEKIRLINIGANGIDVNKWQCGGLYNCGNKSPYTQVIYSLGNKFSKILIDNTGVNNNTSYGAGGSCNFDDDYYGVNIINGSDDNSFDNIEIKNVRLNSGDILPKKSTYRAALRLMSVKNCTLKCKKIVNSEYVAYLQSAPNTTINVDYAEVTTELLSEDNSTYTPRLKVKKRLIIHKLTDFN
ncbi:glycoside hydrolase family 55 protein [Mucilaginibacter daejeonensis]|uniref:glycoside hydrolase family 55 protein n=1 Tax=Mucilaginibacter daejeonensis TaxID=398049 RepID=UPI001D174698|nr:glycoside hydrolase family 55 protein [Mucilaginibacter daejeonensis]UEG54953.1 glycoside hydrolase family 55 protein [Mucilaginibacter daejeonensis]